MGWASEVASRSCRQARPLMRSLPPPPCFVLQPAVVNALHVPVMFPALFPRPCCSVTDGSASPPSFAPASPSPAEMMPYDRMIVR